MTTLSTGELQRGGGIIRLAMQAGDEIAVTFHRKLVGRIVPHDQLEAERAELDRLRKLAADHGLLGKAGEVPAP